MENDDQENVGSNFINFKIENLRGLHHRHSEMD